MRPYERSPRRTYGCPSMTTTHKFDQCSPTSGSVVIILIVLASRNTLGSHPGTALSSARAAAANAIDKTNESTASWGIRKILMVWHNLHALDLPSYTRSFIARDVKARVAALHRLEVIRPARHAARFRSATPNAQACSILRRFSCAILPAF